MPLSRQIWHKILELNKPDPKAKYLINRNPRNLEKLTIARKPSGYHLENPGRSFWHKLEISSSSRFVTAKVIHYNTGPVVQASTSEWAIKKQLYKTNDTSAYVNLARVLAERCKRFGITEMACNIETSPNTKMEKFIKTFESNGVSLSEPERYIKPGPWNSERPSKPWPTVEQKIDVFGGLFNKS